MFYSVMAQSYPTLIPGLRSPHDQVNGLVYFGRMLDKMRLAASQAALGISSQHSMMLGLGSRGWPKAPDPAILCA